MCFHGCCLFTWCQDQTPKACNRAAAMLRVVLKVTFQGHITSSSDPYVYLISCISAWPLAICPRKSGRTWALQPCLHPLKTMTSTPRHTGTIVLPISYHPEIPVAKPVGPRRDLWTIALSLLNNSQSPSDNPHKIIWWRFLRILICEVLKPENHFVQERVQLAWVQQGTVLSVPELVL